MTIKRQENINTAATEINVLRLPIFKTTKSKISEDSVTIDRTIGSDNIHLEITHGGDLTAFDRKVLLIIEYLYLKQNPNFSTNLVITNFAPIARILGIHERNIRLIWQSLSRLQAVNIKTKIKIKKNDKVNITESQFNLLYRVSRNFSAEKKGKRIYTNQIEIELNKWHVENFRNNYYRIVNLSLLTSLRSGIAVRLFDFLNYKAFYRDRDTGKYRQKRKMEISYEDLVNYLHISRQEDLKYVKKQFKTALTELQEKEVIKSFEYERRPASIYIILQLAKSINWKATNPEKVKSLPELRELGNKKTKIETGLEKYGLNRKQINKINNEDHTEEYIKGKISQLEFLKQHDPDKVKGDGRFLYQSIVHDWKDDAYQKHLQDMAKAKISADKANEKKMKEKVENEYEDYKKEYCKKYYETLSQEEKDAIEKNIELNNPFFKKIENANFLCYVERMKILESQISLISFEEFCNLSQEKRNRLLTLADKYVVSSL